MKHLAAVFGLADRDWGQAVVAAVVQVEGASASASELLAYCRARLASFKTPKRIEFVAVLPRNAAGKLLRRELRQAAEGA